ICPHIEPEASNTRTVSFAAACWAWALATGVARPTMSASVRCRSMMFPLSFRLMDDTPPWAAMPARDPAGVMAHPAVHEPRRGKRTSGEHRNDQTGRIDSCPRIVSGRALQQAVASEPVAQEAAVHRDALAGDI